MDNLTDEELEKLAKALAPYVVKEAANVVKQEVGGSVISKLFWVAVGLLLLALAYVNGYIRIG